MTQIINSLKDSKSELILSEANHSDVKLQLTLSEANLSSANSQID